MASILRERPLANVKRLIAVVTLMGAYGCANEDVQLSSTDQTSAAVTPGSIRLLDLDGKRFDLWNAGQSRVRVVLFTRSDCPISNRYAPEVRRIYDTFHPRGVDFYLIYVDPSEQPAEIRNHLREYEYPCPGLRDPEHTLVALTGATVTPEAVVFDGNRNIIYRGRINDLYVDLGKSRAEPTKNDLQDAIEATLAGQPVAEPVTTAVGCYIGDLD